MFPTLLSLGSVTISAFGFFLALSFLFATFLAWRLARAWDLPEEKVLDLCLLTFFGALLGARALFVLEHLPNFADNFFKIILLTKYPGLTFWGGFLGGGLTLFFFTKRIRRLSFWQVADLSAVGLLGGLILGNIGCFLGGCNVGLVNSLGVDMVGFVGKRFPVQLLEALIFTLVLWKIWPMSTHFHFPGKIVSLSLIILGSLEFLLEFLKAEKFGGFIFAPVAFILGMVYFYKLSKRDFKLDLLIFAQTFKRVLTERQTRDMIKKQVSKDWYAQKVAIRWSVYQLKKKFMLIRRRARVKPTPEL